MAESKYAEPVGGGRSDKFLNAKDIKNAEKPYRIRLLGDPISGFEGWTDEQKAPIRSDTLAGLPNVQWRKEREGFKSGPYQFWAQFVYDFEDGGKVKVFQWKQVSVLKGIKALELNPEWGEPSEYDITIHFSENKKTNKSEYVVSPCRKSLPITPEMAAEWKRVQDECIGLPALYNNGDPFATFDEAAQKKDGDIPF